MDEESLEKAQYIGSAEFKIADMKPNVAEDVWLEMRENPHSSSQDQSRGRVHLLLIYKPLSETDPRREAVNKAKEDDNVPSAKKAIDDDYPSSPHLGDEPHL